MDSLITFPSLFFKNETLHAIDHKCFLLKTLHPLRASKNKVTSKISKSPPMLQSKAFS